MDKIKYNINFTQVKKSIIDKKFKLPFPDAKPHYFISNQNSKVYCGIFSLLPIVSCNNSTLCQETCYALRSLRYKGVVNKLYINTYNAYNNLDKLKRDIIKHLRFYNNRYFRIHEAGDFINTAYQKIWIEIINKYPDINFYSYSKNVLLPELKSLDNFNLVKSYYELELYDKSILNITNYDTLNNIKPIVKKFNGFLCPITVLKSTMRKKMKLEKDKLKKSELKLYYNKKIELIKCTAACKKCVELEHVFFVQH